MLRFPARIGAALLRGGLGARARRLPALRAISGGGSAARARPGAPAERAAAHAAALYECEPDDASLDFAADARAAGEAVGGGGGGARGGARRATLEGALDELLAKKATLQTLARELGYYASAKLSIVDAETGFAPWLLARAPEAHAAATAVAKRGGGFDADTRARLLALLVDFAREQSGERDEARARSTDMTLPHEWYPEARLLRRRIVMHVGPTNSGKTHAAMGALKQARSGLYCGPLRLLAWEVHDRLNTDGVPCDLVTGQERVAVEGARHAAVTVEMASTATRYDLCVLDEIQMLGHEQRGWAWTRAFLGLQADELHACGDDSAVALVRRLCALTGDALEVRRYERLSQLSLAAEPLRGVRDVRPGDAVIAFSRRSVYKLKALLERAHAGARVCVVYGSLPPETRRAQASLFNGDAADATGGADARAAILVASDAIGMGLNLNIGRVVFSATEKFDGESVRALLPTEVKQIGGRAGRFRSRFPHGEVGCFGGRSELRFLGAALGATLEPLKACGLLPTAAQLEAFARTAGARPFSQLLRAFFESIRTDEDRYFVCSVEEMYRVARLVDALELTIAERLEFCVAPVDTSDPRLALAFLGYARAYASGASVRVGVRAPADVPRTDREISALEGTHAVLDAYLWLAHKFESQFSERERARALRDCVSALISAGLSGGLSTDGARGRDDADLRRGPGGSAGRRGAAARAAPPAKAAHGGRRRPSRRA